MSDVVYLDNAATTFPKPKGVISAVGRYLKLYCANPGRSSHTLAVKSSEAVYEARESVAKLIRADDPTKIIFTENATHGLNLVIKGIVNEGSHAIITNREHNSVLRPLHSQITKYGGSISVFENSKNILSDIDCQINEKTKLLVVNATSNVTGDEIDLSVIKKIKDKHNIFVLVDASQMIGHKPIDVREIGCDALAAPGHKALFGLQGSGFVYLKDDNLIHPIIEGGNGYDTFNKSMGEILPEKYEAGTLPTPSIVGLAEGIKFINSVGLGEIEKKINTLTECTKEILSKFSGISILGAENGIVSFNFKDYHSNKISNLLDKHGIATRSGYHCAPMIHEALNTKNQGAVRISFSYLNRYQDLNRLYRALKTELRSL